jgi:hypothetical protein
MLYLGIDQHVRQITISPRRNSGENNQRLGSIIQGGEFSGQWNSLGARRAIWGELLSDLR